MRIFAFLWDVVDDMNIVDLFKFNFSEQSIEMDPCVINMVYFLISKAFLNRIVWVDDVYYWMEPDKLIELLQH